MNDTTEKDRMHLAIQAAEKVRCITSPNPWVGCVIIDDDGEIFIGSTRESGYDHAEIDALKKAGAKAKGSTAYVTLEPCSHVGATPPCTRALIDAGIKRVVVGIKDPDRRVNGRGIAQLQDAGIDVHLGLCAQEILDQLMPYVVHRTTNRPYVILKLAMSLDGFIADQKGSSKWITGEQARTDSHKLRAESDAVIVGAGTVRTDDPELTVRFYRPPVTSDSKSLDPLRIVLGDVDSDKKVNPCQQMSGDLEDILSQLGRQGIMQVLIEGGSQVAGSFHNAGLVDKYIFYVAPIIFSGSTALNVLGSSPSSMFDDIWRGRFANITQLGSDLRIDCVRDE